LRYEGPTPARAARAAATRSSSLWWAFKSAFMITHIETAAGFGHAGRKIVRPKRAAAITYVNCFRNVVG